MNARQLLLGADTKKRLRPVVALPESDGEIDVETVNEAGIPQQDAGKVRFEIQKTTKGKCDLWHDGFRFLLHSKTKTKAYWRCEESRPPKRCPVKAITSSENYEEGTINKKAHRHLAKTHGQEIEHRLNNYKERLENDLEIPTAALVDEVKETEDDEMFTRLPSFAALTSLGARKRRRFGHALNAANAASIVIPAEFRLKNGKPFLIHDSADKRPQAADRVLVFASFKKRNCTHPRMHDFLIKLRKYDSRKMNEVRELKLQPDRIYRRVEYRTMDARLKALIQAPLLNDQCIRVFLQAVSLALQGLEDDLIVDEVECQENNGDGEENNEEEAEENYAEDDELFIGEDEENTGATSELIRNIKAPIALSPNATFNLASTSNISSDYTDHDY